MSLYKEQKMNILKTTHEHVDRLVGIWTAIFDAELCESHMVRLDECARNFYEDLIKESLEKKNSTENEIKSLYDEADTLRRLLDVEVALPTVSDDMPLVTVHTELDKSLTELRETLRKRREAIYELLLQQESLCEELGEPPRPLLADPLPTAKEIDDFREHLQELRTERTNRLEELVTLRVNIKDHMKILDLVPNTDYEERLLNQRHPNLTNETLGSLRSMHQRLSAQVDELNHRIDKTRDAIEKLWSRLQIKDEEHIQKIRNATEYTQRTHDCLTMELQRCEALRRQNIKTYVEQLRTEIADWWEKMHTSDMERRRFSNYYNDCYTEDLLMLHELELEDLKHHYTTNHQIYELFADRKVLWDRMTALEAKANEPGRFNNRGGQLLKEERERKTIATKLPKIEQQITELVQQYEEREHKPFTVYGENILELIAKEWEQKRQTKEQLTSARKQSQTPHSTPKAPPRTPLSLKNASAISAAMTSLRKTPSQTHLAVLTAASATTGRVNKRKLNPKESQTPNAKRSLIQVLNSTSGLMKPPPNRRSGSKIKRVIATTIRRRSTNRRSGGGGSTNNSGVKRRSFNRHNNNNNSNNKKLATPKIHIQQPSSDEQTDGGTSSSACEETYDSFKKCIKPTLRSSTMPEKKLTVATDGAIALAQRKRRLRVNEQRVTDPETAEALMDRNLRLLRLPKPCVMRTPSKQQQQLSSIGGGGSTISLNSIGQHQRNAHSPVASSRKLTTKNLPIIM